MNSPRVSIVIATYNDESALRKTIQELKKVNYSNLEIIVIDAKSNDSTVELIQSESNFIHKWISEPDKGIYDAWNKGILRATGDWIAFLGAGDFYVEDGLQKYIDFIQMQSDQPLYVSSKINLVEEDDKIIRTIGVAWNWNEFKKSMRIAHVGSLHSKKLFETYGLFDSSWRIVGDYEFLSRPKEKLKALFLDAVTASMLTGGISASSKALKELKHLKLKQRVRNPFLCEFDYIQARIKLKIRQFLWRY